MNRKLQQTVPRPVELVAHADSSKRKSELSEIQNLGIGAAATCTKSASLGINSA